MSLRIRDIRVIAKKEWSKMLKMKSTENEVTIPESVETIVLIVVSLGLIWGVLEFVSCH